MILILKIYLKTLQDSIGTGDGSPTPVNRSLNSPDALNPVSYPSDLMKASPNLPTGSDALKNGDTVDSGFSGISNDSINTLKDSQKPLGSSSTSVLLLPSLRGRLYPVSPRYEEEKSPTSLFDQEDCVSHMQTSKVS